MLVFMSSNGIILRYQLLQLLAEYYIQFMVRGMNESQSEISNSRRQSLNGRGNNLY